MSDLRQWTVYEDPSDYPGKFVVRAFTIRPNVVEADAEPLVVCDTIEEARAAIPLEAVALGRDPCDDPAIREVWI